MDSNSVSYYPQFPGCSQPLETSSCFVQNGAAKPSSGFPSVLVVDSAGSMPSGEWTNSPDILKKFQPWPGGDDGSASMHVDDDIGMMSEDEEGSTCGGSRELDPQLVAQIVELMQQVKVRGQSDRLDPHGWECESDEGTASYVQKELLASDADELKGLIVGSEETFSRRVQRALEILEFYSKGDDLFLLAEKIADNCCPEEVGKIAALVENKKLVELLWHRMLFNREIININGEWVDENMGELPSLLADYLEGVIQFARSDDEYPLLAVEKLPELFEQKLFDQCVSAAFNKRCLSQEVWDYLVTFSQGGYPLVREFYEV